MISLLPFLFDFTQAICSYLGPIWKMDRKKMFTKKYLKNFFFRRCALSKDFVCELT
jgi:hypothetical protein